MFDNEFFSFVLNTLYLTANSDKRTNNVETELKRLKAIFEIRCVCVAGYMPDVSSCRSCGAKKELMYFDTVYGGSVCNKCFEKYTSPEIIETTPDALRLIEYIVSAVGKEVFFFKVSADTIENVNLISERYLINKLEYISGALEYLKSLWNYKQYKQKNTVYAVFFTFI